MSIFVEMIKSVFNWNVLLMAFGLGLIILVGLNIQKIHDRLDKMSKTGKVLLGLFGAGVLVVMMGHGCFQEYPPFTCSPALIWFGWGMISSAIILVVTLALLQGEKEWRKQPDRPRSYWTERLFQEP